MFVSLLSSSCNVLVEAECEGGFLVAARIATDHVRLVSLLCRLADAELGGEIVSEFSFSIAVVAFDDTCEPFQTQDRHIAAPYIPHDARAHVMPLVCRCLKALVDHTRPAKVYRVTKDRSGSEKALRKHHMLTEALQEMGYAVLDRGTDPHGRRFCMMQRS